MEKLIVSGGKRLSGEISVSGSKNVALKVIIASLLTEDEVTIHNVPEIADIHVLLDIIADIGVSLSFVNHTLTIHAKKLTDYEIPLEVGARIRVSAMLIAPLLAREGCALIPNPGGCRIGARPIDRVIEGLKKMGAHIRYVSEDGYFHAKTKKLHGGTYRFEKNTHTGTETLLIAAVLAEGRTVLENAAQEPEVDDLIAFLNAMRARIKRKDRTIVIDGVAKLHGSSYTIMPDRNETVTFAIASLITEGDVVVLGAQKEYLSAFLTKLTQAHGKWEKVSGGIRFFGNDLIATDVTTSYHPGFMTDWQGPWAVLMTKAKGESTIHETVFENRFSYASELAKMGAHIELFNPKVNKPASFYNFNLEDDRPEYFHAAKIYGPTKLHDAVISISDIRAGATLVLAALAAKEKSVIFGVERLDRGYERLEERLRSLGADVERVKEE